MIKYPVIDADTHWYEPDDCYSRHIDPKLREYAAHTVPTERPGIGRWFLGDVSFRHESINLSDTVVEPGGLFGLFSGKQDLGDLGAARWWRPKDHPEIMDRSARQRWMDEHGIRAQLMLPSANGLGIINAASGMPEVLCANLTAYNRWVEEDWGFGHEGRIYGLPSVAMNDVAWAVKELYDLAARGAKFVWVPTGPVDGRSPADPHFDPFWAAVQDTGIAVCYHLAFSGLVEMYGQFWSEDVTNPLMKWTPMQMYLAMIDTPICHTLAALTLQNLFGRFPGVKILSIELGGDWIRPLLRQLDKTVKYSAARAASLSGLPSEVLPQHLYISPFPEEDLETIAATIGIDHVLFGSDYPHPEGLPDPRGYAEFLTDFSDSDVQKIMHDNTAGLLGLTLAAP